MLVAARRGSSSFIAPRPTADPSRGHGTRAAKHLRRGRDVDAPPLLRYHGWQFAGCGRCTCLPQLEERKEIKTLYDARGYPCEVAQGVVYAYGGRADLPLMDRGDADSMEMSRGDATPAARIF